MSKGRKCGVNEDFICSACNYHLITAEDYLTKDKKEKQKLSTYWSAHKKTTKHLINVNKLQLTTAIHKDSENKIKQIEQEAEQKIKALPKTWDNVKEEWLDNFNNKYIPDINSFLKNKWGHTLKSNSVYLKNFMNCLFNGVYEDYEDLPLFTALHQIITKLEDAVFLLFGNDYSWEFEYLDDQIIDIIVINDFEDDMTEEEKLNFNNHLAYVTQYGGDKNYDECIKNWLKNMYKNNGNILNAFNGPSYKKGWHFKTLVDEFLIELKQNKTSMKISNNEFLPDKEIKENKNNQNNEDIEDDPDDDEETREQKKDARIKAMKERRAKQWEEEDLLKKQKKDKRQSLKK